MLQPLLLRRLVAAKYLPTNYPQIPLLSFQLGPHKRDQTTTTVKAPQRKETHYNLSRRQKEGCGRSSYWWRRNWTWLKSKQNKPPTKHKHSIHFVNGPGTKRVCSYSSAPEEAGWKRQVFKRRDLPLFGWHIYTIMCRIQSSATSISPSQQVTRSCFFFASPPFFFYFGVMLIKWECVTQICSVITSGRTVSSRLLMELHWLNQLSIN